MNLDDYKGKIYTNSLVENKVYEHEISYLDCGIMMFHSDLWFNTYKEAKQDLERRKLKSISDEIEKNIKRGKVKEVWTNER